MPTNSVVFVGRLTKAPELRHTPSGHSVCTLRLAVNRMPVDGTPVSPNYFDVTVWDAQAQSCDRYLVAGQRVGVTGELRYRQWQTPDGERRGAVAVVAHNVEFLDRPAGQAEASEPCDTHPDDFESAPAGEELAA